MQQAFKTILEGIKLKIDDIIANIPKKFSELENDLPVVQSDWNQVDETASDYIKNRTHYHEKKYGFLFAFDTDEGNRPPSNHNGSCIMVKNSGYKFVEGETYTIITVDKYGVEISGDVVCTKNEVNSQSQLNLSTQLINSQNETTNNYRFYQNESESDTNIYGEFDTWINTGGRSMIKLYGYIGEELKQLDEKYIPDTIARKNNDDFVITLIDNGDKTYSADKTFEEILQANYLDKKNLVLNNSCLSESFPVPVPSSLPYLGVYDGGFQFGIFVDENAINPTNNAKPLFIGLVIFRSDIVIYHKQLFTSDINILTTTDKTIIGAINELDNKLPTPDITDSNKVLTVNSDGTTIWSDLPQSDWNQTDENADDYIKNRPFGEEASYEICNTEQSFTFESGNNGTIARASLQRSVYIDYQRINIPTVVVFDGVEYTDLDIYENGGDMCVYIEFTTESGDEVIIIENNEILMPYSYVGTTHTIEIKQEATVVKTIDEKYLPETDKYNKIYILHTEETDDGYRVDKSSEELKEMELQGIFVVLLHDYDYYYPVFFDDEECVFYSESVDRLYLISVNPSKTARVYEFKTLTENSYHAALETESKKIIGAINEVNAKANDSNVFIVTVTQNEDRSYTADKTFAEISEAHNSGKIVYLKAYNVLLPLGTIDQVMSSFTKDTVREDGVGSIFCNINESNQISFGSYNFSVYNNFNELTTTDKTIIGAINELNATTKPLIVTDIGGNTSSLSAEEIYNAKNNGQTVIFKDGDYIYQLVYAEADPSYYAEFSSTNKDVNYFIIINGNTITRNVNVIGNPDELTTTDKTIVGAINELHSELDENNVGSGSGNCFDIIINYDKANNSAELTVGNYNTIMEKFNNNIPIIAMIYLHNIPSCAPNTRHYDYPNYIEVNTDFIRVYNSIVDIEFQIFPDNHININYIG